ncbi:MAG: PorV/PorQ family protein [Candidatus Margulisiibacteriota bacterium]
MLLFFLDSLFYQPATLAQSAGTSGLDFLKLGVFARPASMGEAFVAVSGDIASSYWNPAGLAPISRRQMMFTTSSLLFDMKYYTLGMVAPSQAGVFGLSVGMLTFGDIAGYDSGGSYVGNFSGYDGLINLSWGKRVREFLLVGANLKLLTERIKDSTAAGLALDLGTIVDTSLTGLSFGMNLQNIGNSVKFISEQTPLPLNLKVGLAYKRIFSQDRLLFTSDLNIPWSGQSSYLGTGLEYSIRDFLNLRGGLRFPAGSAATLTAGLGLQTEVFNLDFAYTPYQDIGNMYQLGITLGLLSDVRELKAKKQSQITDALENGKKYFAAKAYLKSINEFNEVLRLDPENKDALSYLKQAIAQVEVGQSVAEDYFAKGKDLYDQGKYEAALAQFNRALASAPEHTGAQEYSIKSREQILKAATAKTEAEALAKQQKEAAKQKAEAAALAERHAEEARQKAEAKQKAEAQLAKQREEEVRFRALAAQAAAAGQLAKQQEEEARRAAELKQQQLLTEQEAARRTLAEQKAKESELAKQREEEARRAAELKQQQLLAEQEVARQALMAQKAKEAELARQKQAQDYLGSAQSLFVAEEYDQALAEANKALDAVPNHREAQALVGKIMDSIKIKQEKEKAELARREQVEREAARQALAKQQAKEAELLKQREEEARQAAELKQKQALAEAEVARQALMAQKAKEAELARQKEAQNYLISAQGLFDAGEYERALVETNKSLDILPESANAKALAQKTIKYIANKAAKEAETAKLAKQRELDAQAELEKIRLAQAEQKAKEAALAKQREEEAARQAELKQKQALAEAEAKLQAQAAEKEKEAELARQQTEATRLAALQAEAARHKAAEDSARQLQAEAYFNIGKNYYQKEDYPAAASNFSQALSLVPGYKDAQKYLTESKQKELVKAWEEDDKQKARALDYYRSGLEKFNAGDYETAIEDLSASLAITPNFERASVLLAHAQEKFKASFMVKEAPKPVAPVTVDKKAVKKAPKPVASVAAVKVAVKKVPLTPAQKAGRLAMSKGMRHYVRYRYAQAETEFAKAVKLMPGHKNAARYLKFAKQRQQAYVKKLAAKRAAEKIAAAKAKAAATARLAAEKAARQQMFRNIIIVGIMLVLGVWLVKFLFRRKKR